MFESLCSFPLFHKISFFPFSVWKSCWGCVFPLSGPLADETSVIAAFPKFREWFFIKSESKWAWNSTVCLHKRSHCRFQICLIKRFAGGQCSQVSPWLWPQQKHVVTQWMTLGDILNRNSWLLKDKLGWLWKLLTFLCEKEICLRWKSLDQKIWFLIWTKSNVTRSPARKITANPLKGLHPQTLKWIFNFMQFWNT